MEKPNVGYSQLNEVKVIRRRHKIAFVENANTAGDLIDMLQRVPRAAKITEVIDSIECTALASIEFLEELTER